MTIEGKNEIHNTDNLTGSFLVHKLLGPRPLPSLASLPVRTHWHTYSASIPPPPNAHPQNRCPFPTITGTPLQHLWFAPRPCAIFTVLEMSLHED